ncbi:hypothetical protein D3C80_970770 [compost metagenome]
MQCLHVRPPLPPRPERLPHPPLLLPIEIPPDPGKTQKQLFDPLLVKLPRQPGPLGPAQQGIDHHRRLQRRRQRLEDPVARQWVNGHRSIAHAYPVLPDALTGQNRGTAARMHLCRRQGPGIEQLGHQHAAGSPRRTVIRQAGLARQPGRVQGDLPVAAAVFQARHPRPAIRQALHRRRGRPGGGLPDIQQADRLRPAQAVGSQRGLAASGFDQEIGLQYLPVVQANTMTDFANHLTHPPLDHAHTRTLKVVPQRPVKPLPIQQKLLVQVQLLAVPVHLPSRRHRRLAQRPTKAGVAQTVQHPLRNPFDRREPAPLGHHRHRVAQPPQANGRGRTRRACPQHHNAWFSHGRHLVARGR